MCLFIGCRTSRLCKNGLRLYARERLSVAPRVMNGSLFFPRTSTAAYKNHFRTTSALFTYHPTLFACALARVYQTRCIQDVIDTHNMVSHLPKNEDTRGICGPVYRKLVGRSLLDACSFRNSSPLISRGDALIGEIHEVRRASTWFLFRKHWSTRSTRNRYRYINTVFSWIWIFTDYRCAKVISLRYYLRCKIFKCE